MRQTTDRTLEDFVEDMISDGRSPMAVRAVAFATRWAPQRDKAFRMAERMKRRIKKKM